MYIFFDTEFTNFTNPQLISIGLAAEDGQEFYCELTDTWTLPECSLFVVGWVLPWLSWGRTGNRLYAKLGQHLDLIQHENDADSLFPIAKKKMLTQALLANTALLEHLRFLTGCNATSELQVRQNPHIATRLQGVSPENLLVGDHAMTSAQARRNLLDWLSKFDNPILCCDSDYDRALLKELVGQSMEILLVTCCKPDHGGGLQLHHALDDAKALRAGQSDEGGKDK